VVRRGGVEEPDPLAADLEELAVVVRAPRQGEDADQLAVHVQVVVHRQLVPGVEPDARAGRVVVAEGDARFRGAAWGGPGDGFAGRVSVWREPGIASAGGDAMTVSPPVRPRFTPSTWTIADLPRCTPSGNTPVITGTSPRCSR